MKSLFFRFSSFFLLLVFLMPATGYGQYWGERVLEKSFEHSNFFFTPNYLNPYGISSFGDAMLGVIDDPVLNLRLNPAFITSDTLAHPFAYLDFRSSKTIETGDHYYPLDYAVRGGMSYGVNDYMCWPQYYVESRKSLEPVISAAYFFRPLDGSVPSLTFGATYQLLFQDERYYGIPTGIYRSNVGYDYGGRFMAEADVMPIIDRYEGSDQMQQRGHLTAFHAGYSILPTLHLGLRLGRSTFDRSGSLGSQNLWDYSGQDNSVWFNMEDRTQEYGHWDLTAGIHYQPNARVRAGLHAGYLWGDATQSLSRQDSSRYRHGIIGEGDDWSHYYRAGMDDQHWDHDGHTLFAGADINAILSPEQKLSAFYRFTRQDVDISLQSAIVDTSFSTYHSIWDYNIYDSESYYSVSDIRAGSGTQEDFSHHAGLSFHWRFDEKTQLSMAGHLMVQDRRTQTTEQVLASRHNFWSWDHEWPDQIDSRSEVRATDEDKELSWDFETKQSSLRIPIFITRKFSDTIELLFGLNRSLLSWEITDVTLALFRFRKENHNGDLTKKEFFGERYTQPTERMSDVSTSVLFGLTVTPTSRFHIRFLMAPEFRNSYGETSLHQLNWWISFNVIQ